MVWAGGSFLDPSQMSNFIGSVTLLVTAVSGLIAAVYSFRAHGKAKVVKQETEILQQKTQAIQEQLNGKTP
jgi:hypothetical protein